MGRRAGGWKGAGGFRFGLKGAPGISGGRAPEGKAGVDGGITARPLRGEIRGRLGMTGRPGGAVRRGRALCGREALAGLRARERVGPREVGRGVRLVGPSAGEGLGRRVWAGKGK